MSEQELFAIRCAGCHRAVAWSVNRLSLRDKIYCEKACARFAPATTEYLRNVEWMALSEQADMAPLAIGRLYGSAHSLVYKTLRKMREAA